MRNVIDNPSATDDRASGAWRTIAGFRTYEEAEAAVDRLSDRGFDVERSAIVAQGMIAGAIVGGLVGFFVQLSTGGRRDFTSVSNVSAERYDVMVDDAVADRARELL